MQELFGLADTPRIAKERIERPVSEALVAR
jgi:hypothetical protein